MRVRQRAVFAAALVVLLLAFVPQPPVRADEGMWTFDNFPAHVVQARYGFAPGRAWLDHVQAASVRLNSGECSGSFISPHGLVMTNAHCVRGCAQQLSTSQSDLVALGFAAKTEAEERPCPAFEIDNLLRVEDVTARVRAALAGKSGAAANVALREVRSRLETACATRPTMRCDLVPLYHGGVYQLHYYRHYTDARLVFVPEDAIAEFGGDPDNFNFPRYDYDVALVRVYENNQPIESPDYLRWSANGSRAGDLVFASGFPGGTGRELTVAQLRFERDRVIPLELPIRSEYRGQLEEFSLRGPEQAREASPPLGFLENAIKVVNGRQLALLDPAFFQAKERAEAQLRAAVAKRPALAAADGSAWNDIAAVQVVREQQLARNEVFGGGYLASFAYSGLLGAAIALVRAAAERSKPNDQRLPEYTDQSLGSMRAQLVSPIPVYKDLQTLRLAFYFTNVRRVLGPDDPDVRAMLGNEAPEALAQRLMRDTQLDEPKLRQSLYDGGASAIAASTDPMIRFAVALDPTLRAVRQAGEERVVAPTRAASQRVADARFAIYGRSVYPDAISSLRLTFGIVRGFTNAQGAQVGPYTTFAGLYTRATGASPFALPPAWIAAKPRLDLTTPFNFVSTDDIIGGNSGSPVIDRNAQIVGVAFDGNIYSLGGDYGYEGARNRMVSVDSRALLAAWRSVYHLDALVAEISDGCCQPPPSAR